MLGAAQSDALGAEFKRLTRVLGSIGVGADAEHARLIRSTEELVAALAEAEGEVCVLPTYTAMLPLRAALAERCGGKEFWK